MPLASSNGAAIRASFLVLQKRRMSQSPNDPPPLTQPVPPHYRAMAAKILGGSLLLATGFTLGALYMDRQQQKERRSEQRFFYPVLPSASSFSHGPNPSRPFESGMPTEESIPAASRYPWQEYMPGTSNLVHFDDIQGCDEAKQRMIVVKKMMQGQDGFDKPLLRGVLLTGPPGTGKTMLAKAMANEAGVPFLVMSGASFDEKYVGVGSKRVRELFGNSIHSLSIHTLARAKELRKCIIFIDEIDAMAGKSSDKEANHHRQTLNQLLIAMDGFDDLPGVVVIGATNRPELLEPALRRPGRFDWEIHVGLPNRRGREAVLRRYLREHSLDTDVDVRPISYVTESFSPAKLSALVRDARIKATVEGETRLSQRHLLDALDDLMLGVKSLSQVSTEGDSIQVTDTLRKTAYHEAGHAVAAILSNYNGNFNSQKIFKATIERRGSVLGHVRYYAENEDGSLNKAELLARLDSCLGGRIAEKIFFGEQNVSAGCMSDLASAARIADKMVSKYGMGTQTGVLSLDDETIGDELKNKRDVDIQNLINESDRRTEQLLSKNRDALIRVAEALLKKKTLTGDEVVALVYSKMKKENENVVSL